MKSLTCVKGVQMLNTCLVALNQFVTGQHPILHVDDDGVSPPWEHPVQKIPLQIALRPLRCLRQDEAKRVIQEIHDGDCENHAGGRSLAHKAINQEYY